jgi:putative inorganic carbon (HCO3(-)) transporter
MAFWLLIVYVIVLMLRPQEWHPALLGFRLVDVVAITTILATFLTQRADSAIIPLLQRNRYGWLMWGFFAAMLFSDLVRFRLRWAYEAFEDFGKVVVLFFLALILVDRPERMRKIFWAMVISTALMCVHAYLQVKTGQGFGGVVPVQWPNEPPRVKGTGMFSDPNDLASLFIVATPFVLAMLQLGTGFPSKMLLLGVLPAVAYALYHTHSRGGLIGVCAMLLAYLWLAGKSTLPRLLVASAVLAAVVAFAPGRVTGEYIEGSAGGRVVTWGIGNQLLKQYPLIGVGYQKFPYYANWRAAHSSFVNCYAELGLLGYIFWFALSWLVMKSLLRMAKMPELGRPVSKMAGALFAALVGYHASGFFLTRTYNHILFFTLGISIGLIRYAQRHPEAPPGFLEVTMHDFRKAAVFALASIPFIWILARLYWSIARG